MRCLSIEGITAHTWLMPECTKFVTDPILTMAACVQDPLQRLSIEGITAHPWFLDTLPPNALALNERILTRPMPTWGK